MGKINIILHFLNLDVPTFAKMLGVTPELIYMIQSGTRNISKQLANNIQSTFGIPYEYTFEDKGTISIDTRLITQKLDLVRENDPIYPSLTDKEHGVPYYDIDFIAGFDKIFNNNTVKPSYYIDFQPYNDCDFWVNVSGKSMDPLISHGDIISLKRINNWREFLLVGEIYAIITDEFRTIKTLGKGDDKEHYTLIPYNKSEEYSNQPIPKKIISDIFMVKGSIKKFF